MPDFRIEVTSPTLASPVWVDPDNVPGPGGVARAGRITELGSRQRRHMRVDVGALVRLSAIMDGEISPEADAVVGLFTAWPVEFPGDGGAPLLTYPIAGTSAVAEFLLNWQGHYTLVMRHEDDGSGAPKARAGGAIVVHIDAEVP